MPTGQRLQQAGNRGLHLVRTRPGVAAAAAALVVTLAIAYGSVVASLVRDWATDDNYSHGFLVVPVIAYLVWRQRDVWGRTDRTPSSIGLLLVLGSLGLYVGGLLGAELFLTRISLVGVVAGSLVFLFGWRHLRLLAFPLALTLLIIPLPAIIFNQITFPLQLVASWCGETALSAVGVPVLREGNVITLSTTSLYVAEACSGIRSLVSLLTLALLYGYFTDPRGWVRAALAAASIPTAVLANGARVAGTGIAASVIGPEAAEGVLHTFSGWMVFVVALVLLLLMKRALVWVAGPPARRPARSGAMNAEGPLAGDRPVL
ncbi:MAG TPA: exosortase/archaeosortase family protein [Vicinamibacterales bacterium]|nr:exosortase/archaeosortase family protein [Vicinamibacterales bacterium]